MTSTDWIISGGALAAAISAIIALAAWVAKAVRAPLETSLSTACQDIAAETKDREEAIKALTNTITATIGHKLNNTATRVDALERLRNSDVERLVKVETGQQAIKEGQTRIEHTLELMKSEQASARAEIVDSIREIRTVGQARP